MNEPCTLFSQEVIQKIKLYENVTLIINKSAIQYVFLIPVEQRKASNLFWIKEYCMLFPEIHAKNVISVKSEVFNFYYLNLKEYDMNLTI